MKTRLSLVPSLFGAAFLALGLASSANAALVLTIDEFTTTTFTFSISGTMAVPADSPEGVEGNHPGIFAVTLNQGASIPFFNGIPLKTSGDLTWGPSSMPFQELSTDPGSGGKYALVFSFDSTFTMPATSISGTVTYTGNFNPAAAVPGDFQLWSGTGQSIPGGGYAVFHTQAVPEPSAALLVGVAALGLLRRRG